MYWDKNYSDSQQDKLVMQLEGSEMNFSQELTLRIKITRYLFTQGLTENIEEELNLFACSSDDPTSKRRRIYLTDCETESEDVDAVLLMDPFSFLPLSQVVTWKDVMEEARVRFSVVINQPSGVRAGDFRLELVDSERVLQLEVVQPGYTQDTLVLHRRLLCEENPMLKCHPRVLSVREMFKSMRQGLDMRRSENLKSVVRFLLPDRVVLYTEHVPGLFIWRCVRVRPLSADICVLVKFLSTFSPS